MRVLAGFVMFQLANAQLGDLMIESGTGAVCCYNAHAHPNVKMYDLLGRDHVTASW